MKNPLCILMNRKKAPVAAIGDENGVAAIEFAAIAPVLILLLLGMSEFSDAYMARKKVNLATNTVGDLFAQMPSMNNTDATGIFALADATLQPRPGSGNFEVNVYFVRFDAAGNQTVAWHCRKGQNCITNSAPAPSQPIPANLAVNDSSLVVVEANYAYTPLLGGKIIGEGSITFNEQTYYRPRISNNIPCC